MNPPIVEIKNISFAYNGQPVLQDVNLDIRQGDFIAMIGPNGGGKTTLLKLILGLLKPNRGTIRVMNEATQKASHHIGYVPQNVNINQNFPITAMDVVMMGKLDPRRRWKRPTASDHQDAMAVIDRMEMAPFANRKIAELSGGQRQRIFIARALVTQPQLLLLDEPTASIDTKGQTDFYKLLRELNKDITILVVSHDLLVVSTYAKSMACMNRRLHYHNQNEITGDMLKSMYACTVEEICPVELITQGQSSSQVANE
ncbi:MAG: ABC transporter [Desulfobacterium sp.]|nr:ABC transporter [Desulfobacterium sp.]